MRLSDSWEVKKEFHFVTRDIEQLCRLAKLRTSREEAVFGNLVHRKEIFTERLTRVSTRNHKVSRSIVSWLSIQYFPSTHFPFDNFRGDKESSVGITFVVKLGMQWAKTCTLYYTSYYSIHFDSWDTIFFTIKSFIFNSF